MVLHASSTPRQPGGRNWLWQKVQVKGLDQALGQPRVADFLSALAGPEGGSWCCSATPSGAMLGTLLDIKPATNIPEGPLTRPIGDVFSEMVSDLTGRIVTAGVQASVRGVEHQQELDQPVHPRHPFRSAGRLSGVHGAGADRLSGVAGLVAPHLAARRWLAEYAGEAGYWAARIVRGAVFLLIFLPLTAPVAAPYNVVRQVIDTVMAPVRWWRWLTGARAAPSAG